MDSEHDCPVDWSVVDGCRFRAAGKWLQLAGQISSSGVVVYTPSGVYRSAGEAPRTASWQAAMDAIRAVGFEPAAFGSRKLIRQLKNAKRSVHVRDAIEAAQIERALRRRYGVSRMNPW